jgi:hypothetical protein
VDSVADGLRDGRKLPYLTIVDGFSRECPAIEVDTPINARRVTAVLERLADVAAVGQRQPDPAPYAGAYVLGRTRDSAHGSSMDERARPPATANP